MKVIVFGATGRVGASTTEYALRDGHEVTAFVRDGKKVASKAQGLSIFEGEATRAESVSDALDQGFDAVIMAVGGNVFRPSTVVQDSVTTIVGAMERAGIGRYLGVSGVAFMRASLLGRVSKTVLRLSPVRHGVRDHEAAFRAVRDSGLDYALAACPHIRDGKRTGDYVLSPDYYPGGYKHISPEDVADFFVNELTERRFHREIVGVWY